MNAHAAEVRPSGAIVTELHASVCALLGALLLASDVITLARGEGPWPALAVPLAIGAGLGATAAVLPWLWVGVPLSVRRGLIWTGWLIATVAALGALIPLEFSALAGAQLLLLAAVLPEMSGRPASLRWFWTAIILAFAIMLIYGEVADLRPVAD